MNKEINNIKVLCAEIVEKAKSGHPGAPLGLSQLIFILYTEFINLNPDNPKWLNRDIFILSNGHACAIQYLMNHLIGYISLDDLKLFRQLNSLTPGHPEKNINGIEITTGPLGQGVAASVGFAISSKKLTEINKIGLNNHVYCIFGDGCYQEGISQEAFSLCSRLGLDNITFIYDFNKITIDGPTELSMDEDVAMRFRSLNFDVIEVEDNADEIRSALKYKSTRPKLIILKTKIGKDSELEGSEKIHGNPLGEENIIKLKQRFGLPDEKFYFTSELKNSFKKAKDRMRSFVRQNQIDPCKAENEKVRHILQNKENREYKASYCTSYQSKTLATRSHIKNCIDDINTNVILLPGCADLSPSINIKVGETSSYIHYGIREHSMCGIMNGVAAHGIFTPISGTFLNFATYAMPSIRLACLDKLKTIYVFTHDSIGLGEDGPTHQPIEVLATLRALPNIVTLRPCDGRETRTAVAIALKNKNPTALILSRQKLNDLKETVEGNRLYCEVGLGDKKTESLAEKGAYFIKFVKDSKITLIATGSEVELALKASENLSDLKVSVVSMMSFELFDNQNDDYKCKILDKSTFIVSIEALSTFGWSKYSDFQIGLDEFGRSAPYQQVFDFFGFTPDKLASKIREEYSKFTKTDFE